MWSGTKDIKHILNQNAFIGPAKPGDDQITTHQHVMLCFWTLRTYAMTPYKWQYELLGLKMPPQLNFVQKYLPHAGLKRSFPSMGAAINNACNKRHIVSTHHQTNDE